MPTYEYECKQFTPPRACPACGGIIFKGHGFYATDYADGSAGSRCWTRPAARGGDGASVLKNK